MGFLCKPVHSTNPQSFGEIVAIHENRWILARVLAQPNTNMCCAGEGYEGLEDDKKVKEDFKILIFFGLAFSLKTPSFDSILILFSFSPPSKFFLRAWVTCKEIKHFLFRRSKWPGVSKVILSSISQKSSNKEHSI